MWNALLWRKMARWSEGYLLSERSMASLLSRSLLGLEQDEKPLPWWVAGVHVYFAVLIVWVLSKTVNCSLFVLGCWCTCVCRSFGPGPAFVQMDLVLLILHLSSCGALWLLDDTSSTLLACVFYVLLLATCHAVLPCPISPPTKESAATFYRAKMFGWECFGWVGMLVCLTVLYSYSG